MSLQTVEGVECGTWQGKPLEIEANLLQMQDWFIERFVDSFITPPEHTTLDIDTMDDPTRG